MIASLVQALLAVSVVTIARWFWSRLSRSRSLGNIPGPNSSSLIAGNMVDMYSPSSTPWHEQLAMTYGRVVRLNGLLGDSQLLLADPKALTHVLLKHQDIFEESYFILDLNTLIFGPGLLSTFGDHHRRQRKLLNPVFSTNHMRRIIPIFHSLQDIMRTTLADGPQEIDMLDWLGRLALELIAQAGLGHSFHTLDGNINEHDRAYSRALKEYIPAVSKLFQFAAFLPMSLSRAAPSALRHFLAQVIPWHALHETMHIAETMHLGSRRVWEHKKALFAQGGDALASQVGEGRDVISVLLKENAIAAKEDRLADDELLAQLSTFLFAGTDTTSNALARILHVLALHPDVQERLRDELVGAGTKQGQLGYDELVALPYLDAVCRETLRLYAPANLMSRTAREGVILPLDKPIKGNDGREMHEIFLPKDTEVVVNIIGINRDPIIWGPDAHQWKPERWLSPLPDSVLEARVPGVYGNMLTFLGGGRACIGFKSSQLEIKVVLSQLIPVVRFELSDKEIDWRFGAIMTPSVKGDPEAHPKLPMKVSLV
ncbi:cytochrome P450 [Amylostereum chailletii]|nr:cytochrome P450 [Amylostereum chailletii]